MSNLTDKYPDTAALAEDSFTKIDSLLTQIDAWKDDRFANQMQSFKQIFGEDEITALVIRALEKHGIPGIPENGILMAMFSLVPDIFIVTLDMIANEDVRI